MWYKLSYFIATGFWTGLCPHASGTATSLVTAIVAYLAWEAGVPGWWMAAAAALSFLVGLVVVNPAEEYMCAKWGPQLRHNGVAANYDYQRTTIDELHGQLVACLPIFFMSKLSSPPAGSYFAVSLLIFRLCDVIKPSPIDWVERKLKGSAWGIMLDDTAAGTVSALAICLLFWLCR